MHYTKSLDISGGSMQWMHQFDLFLFDFDGLLADTESLHYRAYQQMCIQRQCELPWDFKTYCLVAHSAALKLEEQIYAAVPQLYKQEPNWTIVYKEKSKALESLLVNEGAALMPGVEELLTFLQLYQKPRAVVTHSADWIVQALRRQHPILNSIPHWITREHYSLPKPHPECYQIAIKQLAKPNATVIGFEDSPRGTEALIGSGAHAVIVTQNEYEALPKLLQQGVKRYSSMEELLESELSFKGCFKGGKGSG